ncbi:MAG: hypothetical protein HYV53_04860 [Parcubacteria group bacterium]|nr:hypothetical protein [Parcubacteria group bacterium]
MNTKCLPPTKIIALEELSKLQTPLPKSWTKAAGLLRRKRQALENHLKKLRRE